MRVLVLACCAVLLIGAGAVRGEHATAAPAHRALTTALIGYEREAWAAYSRRDVAAPHRLAADYSDLQADGSVLDRAGHLAFVPEANLASYELDQFRASASAPTQPWSPTASAAVKRPRTVPLRSRRR